jgi:hypothetical protein
MKPSFTTALVALVLLFSAACGHFQRMDLPEQVTRVERKARGTATITNTTPVSDHAPTDEPRLSPPKRIVVPPV